MTNNYPLEWHTRSQIDLRLRNLGWNLNEKDPNCNVYQGHPKTKEEQEKLEGKFPDYILYEEGTSQPIAVIEAKKPGEDLDEAMDQAVNRYARKIDAPLAFAFNDTFVQSVFIPKDRPLKIDGEELQDFIDQHTALRFLSEGPEILSAPKELTTSRDELIKIFKKANNLLREEGLRDGFERFSAFADILFLKLIDESERLRQHQGKERTIESKYCWSSFIDKPDHEMLEYIHDSVWPRLSQQFGDIFNSEFVVKKDTIMRQLTDMLGQINFTATDIDVKGDAFEFFLKSVTNGNKDLGEYFTPRHIIRTMVNLTKPKFGEKIYDPFCGTGGFLVEAFKYLRLRIDDSSEETMEILKNKSLYGREITSTSRIAKMNMILFGDGHTTIKQMDTLENPVNNQYDVVLTNIPYSQETKFGSYYPIPTKNADSVCIQHIFQSLKPNGRAAIIVPETFFYEEGVIGETRKLIMKNAKRLSIVSLPRGVFLPYTPTKTNILFFEKGEEFKNAFFFVVKNDGFQLTTKRKPIEGASDLKELLSTTDEPEVKPPQSNIVSRDEIEQTENLSLRPYSYMEHIIKSDRKLTYIKGKIKERLKYVEPYKEPDKEWGICEVSQQGVFLGDVVAGRDINQKYKVVHAGDLVYNPYRVNIGSIGIVPPHLDGYLASPAYVVFFSDCEIPNYYFLTMLKHKKFQDIIMSYALGSARASLPLSELERIAIPEPTREEIDKVSKLGKDLSKSQQETYSFMQGINEYSKTLIKK